MSKCVKDTCNMEGSQVNQGYCPFCFNALQSEQFAKKRKWAAHDHNSKKLKQDNLNQLEVLERETIFVNVAKFMTTQSFYQFTIASKQCHNISSDSQVWKAVFESKYGPTNEVDVKSMWKKRYHEVESYCGDYLSWNDFVEKPHLLKTRLYDVEVLAKFGRVNSPFIIPSHVNCNDIPTVIDTIWSPISQHLSSFIQRLKEGVQDLYVYRDTAQNQWYLLYLFNRNGKVRVISGGAPLKNSHSTEVKGWGQLPKDLADFYQVHDGLSRLAIFDHGFDHGIDAYKDLYCFSPNECTLLQFNADGCGCGQSFVRYPNGSVITADFDRSCGFHPNDPEAVMTLWEFIDHKYLQSEENESDEE